MNKKKQVSSISYFSILLEVEEELAAIHVVEDEVQLVVCLERVVQVHNERMLNFL